MEQLSSSNYSHTPVMLTEAKEFFQNYTNKYIIDCTLGEGGHSEFFLKEFYPDIKILGIERDPEIIRVAEDRLNCFKPNVVLFNGSFSLIDQFIRDSGFDLPVTGILFDLGISSYHVDRSERGFTFSRSQRLDMRFNPDSGLPTAEEVVNSFSREDLADIFFEYGEERRSRRIAGAIAAYRKKARITDSVQLAEIVAGVFGGRRGRIHPATRVFQALRIFVNGELSEFRSALSKAVEQIGSGGKVIVISYHSLEDRIVKRFFKSLPGDSFRILTKKPLTPSQQEINFNRRARSAKMRVIMKETDDQ